MNSIIRQSCRAMIFAGVISASASAQDSKSMEQSANVDNFKAKYPMYLCVDMPLFLYDSAQQKMVYTYVDGKRTKCMPESEFRTKFRMCTTIPTPPSPTDVADSKPAGKNLVRSDFSNKDLMNVNFQAANLEEANFSNSDLRGANFRYANCKRANFEGAFIKGGDLKNADLTDAKLYRAYFVNTDLSTTKGLTLEKIRFVETLHNCKLDPELHELVQEYCPAKLKDLSFNWGRAESVEAGK